jgi:acyl-CoA thioester hydrolase
MDALGHVNNVVYFRYMESSRVAFLRGIGWDRMDPARKGIGFILQNVNCRFRRPIEFPDTLKVTSRLISIESDRFTLEHEVISERICDVAALGAGTIVVYDYPNACKIGMPPEMRQRLEASRRR